MSEAATMYAAPAQGADRDFLSGGGEMGALMRAYQWDRTSLGSPASWPQSLKMAVRIMLTSRQPIWIGWGKELTYFYNDPYKSIIGGKHPEALGRPTREVWHEIWGDIGPMLDIALGGDQGTYVESQLLVMERNGYPEETYYTFSYSPIPNDDSTVGGIICANSDDTQRVIGERQLALLRDLAADAGHARNWQDACERSAAALAKNPRDLPFALIYVGDPEGSSARLAGLAGIERKHPGAPDAINIDGVSHWPVGEVLRSQVGQIVPDLGALFGSEIPTGPWASPPSQAALIPILPTGETGRAGVLIVGLNPFRLFDENYRGFLSLVAGQIAAAIANAQAYEEERRRAEALAEIDRAKTTFFSNVSHEFRTPLTLMLGPVEDVLNDSDATAIAPVHRNRLETAHRNSLRLLKLVNSLLDFSRIEAGRVDASFEAVDLARLTTELASNFESAIEKAGLTLRIDCADLGQPVHVDREMWEKIVLNLLSNAFKFTFEGEIAVELRNSGDRRHALLTIRDTGVGIPESELPRLFERFHRIEGQRSRSFEGSGIGLALVSELVKLHLGAIRVESEPGKGTAFTVSVPLGSAHLSAEQIGKHRSRASTSLRSEAFVEEALRWLPTTQSPNDLQPDRAEDAPELLLGERTRGARILVADDNADMRNYVRRLLGSRWKVETVSDGQDALEAIRQEKPDLLLTDVMMPRVDGFSLLREIRSDHWLRDLPVVMLSARAGEEARVEGLDAGADDYLTKPFSARELIARVNANLEMARLRRKFDEQIAADFAAIQRLYDIGNICARSNTKLDECLGQILEAAIAFTGADKGNIQLLDPTSDTLRIVAQRGFASPFLDFFSAVEQGEASVCGAALQSAERVLVEDVSKSDIFAGQPSLTVLLDAGVRAVQSTPLRSGGGAVLGMISTHFSHPVRLGQQELRLMDLLARQAADFLERMRSDEALRATQAELRELNEELEQKVEERSRALEETERRFRLLVDAVTDYAIFMLDPTGHIVNWNTGAQQIKGYSAEEVIGRHFSLFYTEEDRANGVPQQVLAAASSAGGYETEGWRVRKDRTRFWANVVVSAIRSPGVELVDFAKVTRDLTEKRALEERLRQSQKMEAVGNLTGGVAHDFNNVLQVIGGNLQLVIRDVAGNLRAEQRLQTAIAAISRGSKLASQLLAFGRRQPLAPKVVNIGRLIRSTDDMLRRALGEGIEIETVIAGGLWNTFVDTAQVENAILNLAINARDAMEGHGKLTIEAGNAFLDADYAGRHLDIAAGQYVMIAVTDTGCGIPADIIEQVFEPFFTTKPEGQGTGLGLSMVYGFVKQSGGHVKIYSEPGQGTTVRMYLPRTRQTEDVETDVETGPATGGSETILVVEDDEELRSTVVDMLSDLGYRVLKAKDASSALAIIESGVPIDLLFTDVVMPGTLRSPELARKAQERLPGIAVLFTSGYTANAIVHGGRLDEGIELLSKPYTREAMARKIRHVLRNQQQRTIRQSTPSVVPPRRIDGDGGRQQE
ncbi:MAG: response regulator, partial [Acidobacteriaceae bacterium]|nr:response regulator [Acidobacteriaceae bacterium]